MLSHYFYINLPSVIKELAKSKLDIAFSAAIVSNDMNAKIERNSEHSLSQEPPTITFKLGLIK